MHIVHRLKTQISSRYGLKSQPRLVDIIAAVPSEYKKVHTYTVLFVVKHAVASKKIVICQLKLQIK